MKFAEPYWLLVGLAACLFIVWRYRRFDQNQRTSLTGFVSPRLAAQLTRSLSIARRATKRALVVAGMGCLFIALARPQAGYHWVETHRQGRDILFAVDTSRSMLTPDVKPNRLTRAKLAVDDLLDKLDGDGTGLIAFAGSAFLQCPITLDYDAFRDSVNALDTSTIPRGGTDIASAIHEAQAAFKTRANTDKILILLSDGEDLGGDAVAAAGAAAKEGVTIFTVGVGTANGELIPIAGSDGATEFVKDPSGNFVKSRLDEATLRKIAEVTGGLYEPLGPQSQGLTAIYNQGLAASRVTIWLRAGTRSISNGSSGPCSSVCSACSAIGSSAHADTKLGREARPIANRSSKPSTPGPSLRPPSA
jgi:Ca-activated chloride channel family protein